MQKNIFRYILVASSILIPAISFSAPLDGVKGLLEGIGGLLNSTIPVLFGLSLVFFFWGLGQFILHAGDEKTRSEGKQKMIWGIVALFIFVSIYGILNFISSTIGIEIKAGLGLPNSSSIGASSDSALIDCYDSEGYWMYSRTSCP